MALNLSFPDSIYTEANKPVAATLKADLAAIETEVNAFEAATVKATGAEITTGTDDTKFATPKALADATVGKLGSAWTAWTPTVTAGVGTLTTKSGAGYWTRIGKTVHFQATLTITTNGTGASAIIFTLPINALRADWMGAGRENNVTGHTVIVIGDTANAFVFNYDNSYPGGTGRSITVSGTYEVA